MQIVLNRNKLASPSEVWRNSLRVKNLLAGCVGLLATAGSSIGFALAAAPPLEIQLNKLEPVENACRAYLVFRNGSDSSFVSFRLDLMLFGRDGVIARRLAVEAAPLTPGKTSVKLFDIQGLACSDVSQVLLNDVMGCRDATGERNDCASLIQLSSKSVEFNK